MRTKHVLLLFGLFLLVSCTTVTVDEMKTCTSDSECVLVGATCCGAASCDFESVNREYAKDWSKHTDCWGKSCIQRLCADGSEAHCLNNRCEVRVNVQEPLVDENTALDNISQKIPKSTITESVATEGVVIDPPDDAPQLSDVNGSACSLKNACDGLNIGDEFLCDFNGVKNPNGLYACTCRYDCTVSVAFVPENFCQPPSLCQDRVPGTSWECSLGRGAKGICHCDKNCMLSSVCNQGNFCDGKSVGAVYVCGEEYAPDPLGKGKCQCSNTCEPTGECVLGDSVCRYRAPGVVAGFLYMCDEQLMESYTNNDDMFCYCNSQCRVERDHIDRYREAAK